MMFYVARTGEKMGRIANEFYGNELGSLMLPKLVAINAHTLPFNIGMAGEDVLLPPYHIVYFPEFDLSHQFYPWKFMVRMLNASPVEVRKNIGMLCESGIDPRFAITVKEAGGDDKSEDHNDWETAEDWINKLSNIKGYSDQANEVIETWKNEAKNFSYQEAKKNMKQALKYCEKNHTVISKKYLQESYKLLQSRFEVEIYRKMPLRMRRFQKTVIKKISKRTFIFHSIEEVKKILKVAEDFKFIFSKIGDICEHIPFLDKIIDYGEDGLEVYEDYKTGKDWKREAARDIAEISIKSGITASVTAILCLTPLGWGALLVSAGADYIGGKIAHHAVDYIWAHQKSILDSFSHYQYVDNFI